MRLIAGKYGIFPSGSIWIKKCVSSLSWHKSWSLNVFETSIEKINSLAILYSVLGLDHTGCMTVHAFKSKGGNVSKGDPKAWYIRSSVQEDVYSMDKKYLCIARVKAHKTLFKASPCTIICDPLWKNRPLAIFYENRVLGMDQRRFYCRVQWSKS